jgi:hypothetical protein
MSDLHHKKEFRENLWSVIEFLPSQIFFFCSTVRLGVMLEIHLPACGEIGVLSYEFRFIPINWPIQDYNIHVFNSRPPSDELFFAVPIQRGFLYYIEMSAAWDHSDVFLPTETDAINYNSCLTWRAAISLLLSVGQHLFLSRENAPSLLHSNHYCAHHNLGWICVPFFGLQSACSVLCSFWSLICLDVNLLQIEYYS